MLFYRELARDAALIVVPTLAGALTLALLFPGSNPVYYDLFRLLSLVGGGTLAGWLFRKEHGASRGTGNGFLWACTWRELHVHALALAVIISIVFVLTHFLLEPATYHALLRNPSVWVLWVVVPVGVALTWGKVFTLMLLGQWLQGRQSVRSSF